MRLRWVCIGLLAAITAGPDLAAIYQYSVPVGSSRAYLWIPPRCERVRGVIVALANLTERDWLEDPIIRGAAADEGLGIVWVGGSDREAWTSPGMTPGEELDRMLRGFARVSGYAELADAPLIPMGHSAHGPFAWEAAECNPGRVIAAIPVKTVPLPASLGFTGVPLCYVVGQTTEWPQFRVPDPAARPGDRDFFWPVVRDSAVALREAGERNLVGVVVDPGGGHFDWSENDARFVALYIRKACEYRLPRTPPDSGPVKLNRIAPESGWLTDTGGMLPDRFAPAPYRAYRGDPRRAYWFFDGETARAAAAFEGDRRPRERQMPTFVQDGRPLPVAFKGYASLRFEPERDGVTFRVAGAFLRRMPRELIGAGEPLGHAPGPIRFSVIEGPAVQVAPDTFRVRFDRGTADGALWLLEESDGDSRYRRAVQPGRMAIPARLTAGRPQTITFPPIADQPPSGGPVELRATSDSGLPVDYYVEAGPAEIRGRSLVISEVPRRSRLPIAVTVVATQWGRPVPPKFQSAAPVERTFLVGN